MSLLLGVQGSVVFWKGLEVSLRPPEEELYLAAGGGSLDVGLGPVGVVGHSAAGEGLLDIVPGLSHSGVPSLVVVVEPGRHLVLDTLGQVVLQDKGRDGGPELCEEDGDHQSRVDVDHA